MTRVLVADQLPLMREAVRNTLERLVHVEVVGEAADGEELVRLTAELKPDAVLLDVDIPKFDMAQTIQRIRAENPDTKVLVLTMREEAHSAERVLRSGADGYILKSVSGTDLVDVFRVMMMGERVLDRTIEVKLARLSAAVPTGPLAATRPGQGGLSERDLQLLQWMVQGATNAEIGKRLRVSERTAKGYVGDIFDKLGATSRLEAIVAAVRLGVLKL